MLYKVKEKGSTLNKWTLTCLSCPVLERECYFKAADPYDPNHHTSVKQTNGGYSQNSLAGSLILVSLSLLPCIPTNTHV